MPLSRRRLPARRYEEPLPRADGAFQPGIRRFTIQCNIWTLNGLLGRLNGIEGGPNATVRKPIADYVKNVLKGRKAHGIKHVLQKEWAQLPANQPAPHKGGCYASCRRRKEGPRGLARAGRGGAEPVGLSGHTCTRARTAALQCEDNRHSSSSSSRGCSKHPLPFLCVHVCLCVRLCLVPCDLRRSEIYLQCLCACRPVRVSHGAMGDMVRAACGRRRPPVFSPSLMCRYDGCSRRV